MSEKQFIAATLAIALIYKNLDDYKNLDREPDFNSEDLSMLYNPRLFSDFIRTYKAIKEQYEFKKEFPD
jgi:hypothetical protein